MGEWIRLTNDVNVYRSLPAGGSGPGVLVLHAWWGLNGFFQELCDRLAAQGFVAVAPDLYGGEIATTIPEAEALNKVREQEEPVTQIVEAALDYLGSLPGVSGPGLGVVGCSMGAWWSLKLAVTRPEQVRAVVLFYGTGAQNFHLARAAFQGHYAENDPYESAQDVDWVEEQVRAAGRAVDFYRYPGTAHWFVESDRPEYDPQAAALAWERTVAFLRRQLG